MSYLTEGMRLYAGGKIGVCALPETEKLRMGVTEDDADAIAGFARDLEGVEIGVMLRDLPDNQCKISLRTDNRLHDASAICRRLGGGGHSAAAGATVSGTLEDGRRAEPARMSPPSCGMSSMSGGSATAVCCGRPGCGPTSWAAPPP